MMMMAKKEKDSFPVTEESFFLDDSTMTNDWMENVMTEAPLEGELAVDVYETAKEIVVKAPIAGIIGNDDLDITVDDDLVVIRGERKEEKEVDKDSYHASECYWGAFSRTITLPKKVISEQAAADFKKGILTIRLPKAESAKVKKIKVNLG